MRLVGFAALILGTAPATAALPNVVLIVTDDQGYGDLGCHGNPVLKTPHLDALARQSVELTHFYVSPVCAPTRASLLTGRYNYRTGAVDTYLGRAMMRPDEVTLAQIFQAAGYRTGLFGKWHLGDNYPLRPQDRGFGEVLRHHGGGIAQPSDPPGSSYFKPILDRNGRLETFDRYCSDVYTDAALDFIAAAKGRPFFAYLAFNCPHTPLQAQDADAAPYRALDLTPARVPESKPKAKGKSFTAGDLASLYGMVANVDANVGRLLAKLDGWGLARDTIVIFLTDNGPQQARYNAGLRGLKGSTFDGGIRVPCLVRHPAKLAAGAKRDAPAAHIDLLPTLCEACGLTTPADRVIDGTSLWPYLTGTAQGLPPRDLFFQWHRGDEPERGRAYAVRGPRFKLVQAVGATGQPIADAKPMFFDMTADPNEKTDLAAEKADVAAGMQRKYEAWFADVTKAGFAPVRIVLGSAHENPVRLTRQDWRGPRATDWAGNGLGHWEVTLAEGGAFDLKLRFAKTKVPAAVRLRLAGNSADAEVPAGAEGHTFVGLQFPNGRGDAKLEAWVERGGETVGVLDVEVTRR